MNNNDDDDNDNNDNNDDNDNEEKTKRSIAIAYSRLLFILKEMSCTNFNKKSVLHIIMMSIIVTYLIFVRG